jgi:glutamate--cysteine ligase
MIQEHVHEQILNNCKNLQEWLLDKTRNLYIPVYSSYDIRDSGQKVVNVDANIFPAGFNNICPTDKDSAVAKVKDYLHRHYGNSLKRILLLTEEHTNNLFYWENVYTLSDLIQKAGFEIRVAIPRALEAPLQLQSATGKPVTVWSAVRDGDSVSVGDFKPDLIISNNDFSDPYEEWSAGLLTPMNPPRELGWYQRKKDQYFKFYNELAGEFAQLIGVDPWQLQLRTTKFDNFDITSEKSADELAGVVDQMITELRQEYRQRGLEQEPFIFIKNNSGTYGLAVVQVSSGDQVRSWNYKTRKKMKAAKGGRDVQEVIVQEGVSSIVKSEDITAEPVIYMIGFDLAGGFLRTHGEKGPTDSLNSPGAVYKKMCVSDLTVNQKGCPMENVYGWVAILGALAIGREANAMNVEYRGYIKSALQ